MIANRILASKAAVALRFGDDMHESSRALAEAFYAARGADDVDLALDLVANLVQFNADISPTSQETKMWLATAVSDAARARKRAPLGAARVYIAAATIGDALGDVKNALAWLTEAHALLGDQPQTSLMDVLMLRASVSITAGNQKAAIEDYRNALAMAASLYGPNAPRVAQLEMTVSAAMTAMNRPDEAIRLANDAEAVLALYPDLLSTQVAHMKLNLGVAKILEKDFTKARRYLTEARAITVKLFGAEHSDVALVDANLGYADLEERNFTGAEAYAKKALALMERVTPKPHEDRGMALLLLSDAARGQKDHETAITAAIASAEEYGTADDRRRLSLLTAAAEANDTNQLARALAIVETARALPAPEDTLLVARTHLEYGRALGAKDPIAARKALDEARRIYLAEGAAEWVAEVDAARAKLR
jgi:hypothetical protein